MKFRAQAIGHFQRISARGHDINAALNLFQDSLICNGWHQVPLGSLGRYLGHGIDK